MVIQFLASYYRVLKWGLAALLAVMIVPVTLQIISRYTGLIPKYIWTEEVARFCFVWLIMIGSIVGVREGAHFEVDVLPLSDEPARRAKARLVIHGLMCVLALVFAWFGYEFAVFGSSQQSEMSGINMVAIYASFPVAGLSWCLFLFEKIAEDIETLVGASPGGTT